MSIKDRFGQVDVSKVPWAVMHLTIASLASTNLVNGTLSWIHDASNFGLPSLHCLWINNTIGDSDRLLKLPRNISKGLR